MVKCMKVLKVIGNKKLSGTIRISGAKNSAVALIPGSLLGKGITTICNVPNILDIDALEDTLKYLNVKVTRASGSILVDTTSLENKPIPYELSSRLRASYYFMSVLLARFNYMEMSFPGGCDIGSRPIDQTLKAFKACERFNQSLRKFVRIAMVISRWSRCKQWIFTRDTM